MRIAHGSPTGRTRAIADARFCSSSRPRRSLSGSAASVLGSSHVNGALAESPHPTAERIASDATIHKAVRLERLIALTCSLNCSLIEGRDTQGVVLTTEAKRVG